MTIEILTAIAGLLIASSGITAAVTRWLTRWQATRSAERRDALTQLREAYQLAVERIARVEGRADELSKQNIHLQEQASAERLSYTLRIAQLEARIAQLEHELSDAKEENARLRGAPPPRRSMTPPAPMPAVIAEPGPHR